MRKALVGIAAAVMLTTLVIAIVPAFGQPTYPLHFSVGTATTGFALVINSDGSFALIPSKGRFDVCDGLPGSITVSHGFLRINGVCATGILEGGQFSGSGIVNGLVMLTVSFQGKPATSVTFLMMSGCPWCG